jgi:hypothetical protein
MSATTESFNRIFRFLRLRLRRLMGRSEFKYRILFICHGGTIGMLLSNGVLAAPKSDRQFRKAVSRTLRAFRRMGIEITYEFRTSKDSTDVEFSDWVWLARRVERAHTIMPRHLSMQPALEWLSSRCSALAFSSCANSSTHRNKKSTRAVIPEK